MLGEGTRLAGRDEIRVQAPLAHHAIERSEETIAP